MPSGVVLDSSLIYALFDADDAHHQESVDFIRQKSSEYFATFAVVTEVAYLLRFDQQGQVRFLRWLRAGSVILVELIDEDLDSVIRILEKYRDLPADFADATIVAIADRLGIQTIASFDKDFRIYRYRKRYAFKTPLLNAV